MVPRGFIRAQCSLGSLALDVNQWNEQLHQCNWLWSDHLLPSAAQGALQQENLLHVHPAAFEFIAKTFTFKRILRLGLWALAGAAEPPSGRRAGAKSGEYRVGFGWTRRAGNLSCQSDLPESRNIPPSAQLFPSAPSVGRRRSRIHLGARWVRSYWFSHHPKPRLVDRRRLLAGEQRL